MSCHCKLYSQHDVLSLSTLSYIKLCAISAPDWVRYSINHSPRRWQERAGPEQPLLIAIIRFTNFCINQRSSVFLLVTEWARITFPWWTLGPHHVNQVTTRFISISVKDHHQSHSHISVQSGNWKSTCEASSVCINTHCVCTPAKRVLVLHMSCPINALHHTILPNESLTNSWCHLLYRYCRYKPLQQNPL